MTAADLIRQSLLDVEAVGYADTVPATLTADGLIVLNNLISAWNAERLLIPSITKVTKVLTVGLEQYSIGSGGDINTTRPMSIASAWVRDTQNVDYPLTIKASQDYAIIRNKTSKGRPRDLFYNPAYTLGRIFLYYVPDLAYTLNLDLLAPLSRIALSTDTINTPDEWLRGLAANLAYELAPRFDVEDILVIKDRARESKDALKDLNAPPVPESFVDNAIMLGGRNRNIETDS
jgi:hypothetical protein